MVLNCHIELAISICPCNQDRIFHATENLKSTIVSRLYSGHVNQTYGPIEMVGPGTSSIPRHAGTMSLLSAHLPKKGVTADKGHGGDRGISRPGIEERRVRSVHLRAVALERWSAVIGRNEYISINALGQMLHLLQPCNGTSPCTKSKIAVSTSK